MFGIIRPCRHSLPEPLRAAWLAHLCGLCLALRDGHGQLARTATNYDGLVISVLVEAQSAPSRRQAGPCPLRGMRGAQVADGEGARLAATVSLALASAKVRDHVLDGDGVFARRPVASTARAVTRRWDRQSGRAGDRIGFDTAVLLEAADRQGELERTATAGSPLLTLTEPTETATAAATAHTAVLAGRPGNAAALHEAGRLFGRLAHLLDAAEDQAEDDANGAWNPLTATGTTRAEAERLCRDATHGIQLALAEVAFTDSALPHRLLVHETRRAVDRVFNQIDHETPGAPAPEKPPTSRGLLAGCAMWALLACSCQLLCCDHNDPWSRERREGFCERHGCDCGDCCDCDCCQVCSNCDGCDGCDCCCPCDGC
ncbi:hypothetical protein F4556_006415 [Kitasatospora gansuensis]|uniref:Regulatory protein n=1 Tax=Kitasatospora gansuensis TaxID=258050 RepID=A0A7W7WLB6_9ACTN|nr:DUF5685 family protein [Kitasatospora gansuensis]MBB4950880.1 hypothetical protein [Kitasatospora gansuensis]